MRCYVRVLLVTMVLIGAEVAAQDKTAGTRTPESGVMANDPHSQLQFLVGKFTTETIIPPGRMAPKGATGKGTSVIAWALDSAFLMIDMEGINSVFGRYLGHGMLGFDAQSKEYVLSMFNNFGDRPSYKGTIAGDTLVLATRVPMPGHPFDQKLLWFKEGETVKLKVINDAGKGFELVTEETARRAP
jgi:hypothetical protein